MSDQAPIPSLPEIEYGEGRVGRFEAQRFDMTAFLDLEVSLRVYQHSLVEYSAFFTLLDDLCLGTNQESGDKALLRFGEPDDWGLDTQRKKSPTFRRAHYRVPSVTKWLERSLGSRECWRPRPRLPLLSEA